MDITFADLQELRGMLVDICAGGLAMTVVTPLVLYEELDITVPDTNGDQLLILHARVVNQRVLDAAEALPGETLYRVGLEIGQLRTETRRCLDGLLQTVNELVPIEDRKGA